jgi:hypothetical protein
MAKALTTPPPSSSVARLLDSTAATRAIAGRPALPNDINTLDAERTFTRTSVPRDVPRGVHKRELSLCPETDATLETLVHRLRSGTGARVTPSQVVRAMLRAFDPVAGLIDRHAAANGPWRMPATSRDARRARDEFDVLLSTVLKDALRGR